MSAKELVTTVVGTYGDRTVHVPTGWTEGREFDSVHDWVAERNSCDINVVDVSDTILVKGVQNFAAYEEYIDKDKLITIFKID